MSVRIIADSTADVTESVKKQITTVPLTVHFGDKQYRDGVDIDIDTFYKELSESKSVPMTSQPNPPTFIEAFKQAMQDDDEAVIITISSKLSSTYQSALVACRNDKYKKRVYVVDSMTGTVGTGLLVEMALFYVAMGYSAKEIKERLDQDKKEIRVVGILDTLSSLKRSGRISGFANAVANVMGIKPILEVKDGRIDFITKAHGFRQGFRLLNDEIEKKGVIDFNKPYLISYSGNNDNRLKQYLHFSSHLWKEKVRIARIGSAIGVHLGPGAIVVAFFSTNHQDSDVI